MKSIPVKLKDNSYDIVIGSQILAQLPRQISSLPLGKDAVIITDKTVERLHAAKVAAVLKDSGFTVKVFAVPAGEKSKSGQVALSLIEKIAQYDVNKKIFIIALGGGVIGDLAGFVAAVYKRGVAYIQMPTTLLAQIDSAIGGKVGIDLTVGKNLAGAFYQPKLVFSDVQYLKTLDQRQIRNGLAEAVKYGVILNPDFFSFLEKNHQAFIRFDEKIMTTVVEICARLKAEIVSKDERETTGLRMILNFGHTLGHAVENAAGYKLYHHGEAVALGMRMAAYISERLGMLKAGDAKRLNDLLTKIGLPVKIAKVPKSKILAAMHHDKKFVAGKNRFVLARRIGKVEIVTGLSNAVIESAINHFQN